MLNSTCLPIFVDVKLQRLYNSSIIDIYSPEFNGELPLPLIGSISAGFPSPADDFLEAKIDMNTHLVKNPDATYYAKVNGDSMKDLGIDSGDFIVIDRSLPATNGKLAVCCVDGDFTFKQIKIEKDCCWLVAHNDKYPPIQVTEDNNFFIWGIVAHVIKSF